MVFEEEEHLDEELLQECVINKQEDPLSSNDEDIDLTREQPRQRFRYSLKEKLNAIKVAEAFGNRKAEKLLSIGESCIRKWRSQKADIQSQENKTMCRIIKVKKKPPLREFELPTEIAHVIEERDVNDEDTYKHSVIPKEVKSRKSYFSAQKLAAIAFAEMTSNRKAAKVYKVDESCVRKWRSQKEMLESLNRERGTRRKPNLRYPEVEQRLKEFVQQKIDQEGILLRPQQIKTQSIRIAQELNITDFKGTSSYIFKFMERYQIPSRRNKIKTEEVIE